MKNIKKLFAVLLIAVISFCGLNTVSAANNGSIEIKNAVKGKTYEIYKIFDLTHSGTGDNAKVAYTISSDWVAFFNGAGKDYILSKDEAGNILNQIGEVKDDVNKDDDNIDLSSLNLITVGIETKYINITESNIAEFSKLALVYAATLEGNDGSKVAESTTVEFTGLQLGYYLVYPQGATDVSEDEDGNKYASLASITSTLPNATVVVKAKDPEITKDVDKHTFDVGEYAQFTIKGQVPDTTGFTKYDYIISDEWTKGLELDKTKDENGKYENIKFTVKIGEETYTDKEAVYSNDDLTLTFGNDNVKFELAFKDNGFDLTFDMTKYQGKIGEQIEVTYELKVTEDAINNPATDNDIATENKATLTYSNNPKDLTKKTTTPPQIERVYSSKIVVTKVDGANNETKLAGATFILKGSEGYYQAVMDGDKLVDVEWVAEEKDATQYTTDETGVISFEGLENGEYELIETQAPEGYNKLPKPVKVTVSGSYEKDVDGNNILAEPIPVVTNTTVENFTGTSLPSTGGVGTTLFIIIGSLLMIGSLLVLITNKRMSKESL